MTKYREYFERMLEENKADFDAFTNLHQKYSLNQDANQLEFNIEGEKILKIINDWETRLCKASESAGYSNYVGNLSEKFRGEVRSKFPMIDYIGVIPKPAFALKKIRF